MGWGGGETDRQTDRETVQIKAALPFVKVIHSTHNSATTAV